MKWQLLSCISYTELKDITTAFLERWWGRKKKKTINTGQLYYIWYKVINNVLNISTNL